jgi:ABC-type polysaccharide/polyol phosphate export permease
VRAPLSPAWARSVLPLVLADLRQRYAGSVLGGLWSALGPLVEVAAYAVVFGLVMRPRTAQGGLTYALFVASGILPWSSLREGLESSASSLPDNRWIRRSRVPMELLVARQVLVSATRGACGLLLVLAAAFAAGHAAGAMGVLWPVAGLILQTGAVFGLGMVVAPLATLYPDLRPALATGLTALTFASPIVYPESLLSGPVRAALEWNPFTHFLRLYRVPLGASAGGAETALAVAAATTAALLFLGLTVRDRLWWAARDRL